MCNTKEIAKAVQEVAELGKKGFDAAEKAGVFVAKVFKEPLEEISGLITDNLRFVRWKRLVKMSDEVNQIHKDKGINSTRSVPPKIALPIFENSSLEDDPSIQSLWSHLLANAMDPEFSDDIRYGFIDIIKSLTSYEVKLLDIFYLSLKKEGHLYPLDELFQHNIKKEQFIRVLDISSDQYSLIANNLMRVQLIGPAILTGGIKVGSESIAIYKGIDIVTLTPLGVKFVEACIK